MKAKIKMPDLGNTEAEIGVKQWLVAVGQSVSRGQALMEVETDKAVMEVESFLDGVLGEQCVRAGEETAAGEVIAVIEVQDPQDRINSDVT